MRNLLQLQFNETSEETPSPTSRAGIREKKDLDPDPSTPETVRTSTLTALHQIQFPFSFLVALGVLQVLSRNATDHPITLQWSRHATPLWTAAIGGLSPNAILETLTAAANNIDKDPVWNSRNSNATQITPQDYRSILQSNAWDPAENRLWSGLLTEWPEHIKKPEHFASTSQLHLLTGGQFNKFLDIVRASARCTSNTPDHAITEALWGPWTYADTKIIGKHGISESSLGWSTRALPIGAHTNQQPENIDKTATVATIWLAAEGLRLLPTWNGRHGAITASIHPHNRTWSFPIWDVPLSLPAVYRLLISFDVNDLTTWQQRGVQDVFQSTALYKLTSQKTIHYAPATSAVLHPINTSKKGSNRPRSKN